jgi:hypothetical protein
MQVVHEVCCGLDVHKSEIGAGDGNRIVFQISKPRQNKVLPAAL